MSAPADQGGFTLVELVVAIGLSAIVGGVLATAIVGSFHRQSEMDARARSINTVRQAFERTMRDIRAADPLLSVADNQLVLQETNAAGVVRTLTFSLVTSAGVTAFVMDEADVAANGTPLPTPPRQVIANHVANGSTPVFEVLNAVPDWQPTAQVGPLCNQVNYPGYYAPDCVGTIDVHLRIQPVFANGQPSCATSGCLVDVQDRADIRNNTP